MGSRCAAKPSYNRSEKATYRVAQSSPPGQTFAVVDFSPKAMASRIVCITLNGPIAPALRGTFQRRGRAGRSGEISRLAR